MTFDQILQLADVSISVAALIWIIYRMERGHAAAVTRLWAFIEEMMKDEDRRKPGGE